MAWALRLGLFVFLFVGAMAIFGIYGTVMWCLDLWYDQ